MQIVEVDAKGARPGPQADRRARSRRYDYAPQGRRRRLRRLAVGGDRAARRSTRAASTGKLCFNWYRITVTVPESDRPLRSDRVDGRVRDRRRRLRRGLGRRRAAAGARPDRRRSVVKGCNAPNRVVARRATRSPGQQIPARRVRHERPALGPPDELHLDQVGHARFLPRRQPAPAERRGEDRARSIRRSTTIVPPDAEVEKLAERLPVHRRARSGCATAAICSSAIRTTTSSTAGRPTAQLSIFRTKSGYSGADIGEYGQPGSNGLTLDREGRLTINEHGNRRVIAPREERRSSPCSPTATRASGSTAPTTSSTVRRRALLHRSALRPAASSSTIRARSCPSAASSASNDGKLHARQHRSDGPERHRLLARREVPLRRQLGREAEGRHALRRCRPTARSANGEVFFDMTQRARRGRARRPEGRPARQPLRLRPRRPLDPLARRQAPRHHRRPEQPANFAWGDDDGKTLYMTARTGLYRMRLNIPGVRP